MARASKCRVIPKSFAPPCPTCSTTRSSIPVTRWMYNVQLDIPDEKHAVLRVRDRGVGIPADELKRVFKRFYRVRNRAVYRVKGTGLGLFIVRAIAKAHGGKVFAESAGAGQGTTVTFELPRSGA